MRMNGGKIKDVRPMQERLRGIMAIELPIVAANHQTPIPDFATLSFFYNQIIEEKLARALSCEIK